MSGRIGAAPEELADAATTLRNVAYEINDAAADADRAVGRFTAGSGELVPDLPAHGRRLAALAGRVEGLAGRVDGVARALVDADQVPVSWWTTSISRLNVATNLADVWDVAAVAGHVSVHGYGAARVAVLDRRWGAAERIPMARYRAVTGNPIGVANHRELSRPKLAREGKNAAARGFATRADSALGSVLRSQSLRGIVADTADDIAAMRSSGPVAAAFREAPGVTSGLNAVRKHARIAGVLRVGGRALGPVGVVLDGSSAISAWREGDKEGAATQAAQAIGGAMMLSGCPPVQIAGAVVTAGALVYDKREEIGDFVSGLGARASGIMDRFF